MKKVGKIRSGHQLMPDWFTGLRPQMRLDLDPFPNELYKAWRAKPMDKGMPLDVLKEVIS